MREIKNILFWGSVWGILEATLGWGLHLIHFKGEVLVLYPFGLMCMLAAMRQCRGGISATLKVAGVASLIKLVNLITWPGVPLYYVVNPAVAIFLEGLVTFVFCYFMERNSKDYVHPFARLWMVCLLIFVSFLIFKGWQVIVDQWTDDNPNAHLFLQPQLLWTWLWRAVLQGVMLLASFHIVHRWNPVEEWQLQTTRWSLPLLIIAVITTFYL